MQFEYPIKLVVNKQKEASEDDLKAEKAQVYFGHQNQFGFYPIGRLNTWHGGIHIERSAAITAIADGRVIAYRLPEDYITETTTDEKTREYSNGFILIQHDYQKKHSKTEKESHFTFYSLYMHLAPKKDMEHTGKVPDFYARYEGVVTGDEVQRGLNARMGSKTTSNGSTGKKRVLIPCGAIVEVDPLPEVSLSYLEEHLYKPKDSEIPKVLNDQGRKDYIKKTTLENAKKAQGLIPPDWVTKKNEKETLYQRVKYCSADGKQYTDIYIYTKGTVKDLNNGQLLITTVEDSILAYNKTATKGAVIYDKPNNKGQGKYIKTLKKDKETKLDLIKKSDQWYQIPNQEHYIHADALKVSKLLKTDIVIDDKTVANVDTPIKAGEVLGYTGKYGFKKQASYRAVHVEVFSHDARFKDLYNNSNKFDDRTQYFTKDNTTLQVAKPVNDLKKGTKVKILQKKAHYVQIGFGEIIAIVEKSKLGAYISKVGYPIKKEYFEEVNTIYHGHLQNKNAKLVWNGDATYVKKVGEEFITKPQSETTKAQKSKYPYRRLKYTVKKGEFWVDASVIATEGIEKGQWVALVKDVERIYENEPTATTKDEKLTTRLKVKKLKVAKDKNSKNWWKVRATGKSEDGKKTIKVGWVKKEELEEVNPYNWKDFDWQIEEETGNQYLYYFDEKQGEQPHDFINKIWELVDQKTADNDPSKGDQVLTLRELQNAMKDEGKVDILSKLICKHQSEWDYDKNYVTFEKEVKALYQKGIEQEEYPDEKKHLEQIRDERMNLLKEKIKNLCFWQHIQDGEVATNAQQSKDTNRPKRTFPVTNNNVYHFHPIAFINQMKLLTAPTTPPWLEVALAEAKKAKFIEEKYKPTIDMVKKYHNYCNHFDNPDTDEIEDLEDAWCASFVNWCLDQTNYKGIKSPASQSVLWQEGKLFKRIEEPEHGCIALFTNYVKSDGKQTPKGHVTFLYGKDNNGDLVCLGGNQGNKIKYSRYYTDKVCNTFRQRVKGYGRVLVEQKFQGFFLPTNYPVGNSKELETVNLKELNNKLAGKTVKSDTKNESTL